MPRRGAAGVRVAATADVHVRATGDEERIDALVYNAAHDADVLLIGGDLTDLGHLDQGEVVVEALDSSPIPVIVTLGNHDHEGGNAEGLSRLISASRVHLLERSSVVIDGVGFSGVKGFCGGFGETAANAFGEDSFKKFVTEGVLDAEALKNELEDLDTRRRVALLHYAPIRATVEWEPPEIHAFLGTSHLARALDEGSATVAFHGHAHRGPFQGRTPGGVPVFNVAVPVLQQAGFDRPYHVVEV